jgi:hypothetical protein
MSNAYKPRIMYIECKGGGFVQLYGSNYGVQMSGGDLTGPARIGRVTFSKTGATLYYKGRSFQSLKGSGSKSNYYDIESGEHYWISGPRKDGADALYATNIATEIDDDARREYWTEIRELPERATQSQT